MPIKGDDKKYYNVGYRTGYRAATIRHLGGRCLFKNDDGTQCGSTEVEIHHINGNGLNKRSCKGWPTGRGPEDWGNLEVLSLYCKEHHDLIDGEERDIRYRRR